MKCVDLFIFIASLLGRKNKKLQGCSFYSKKRESPMSHHVKPTRVRAGGRNAETDPGGHGKSSNLPPGCF